MLEEMQIRNLGVITEATLEFDPGFTVLTGETGAGKTMVLTGLGLLLGGRADAAAVRTGAARATVEGRVRVDPDGPVAARAGEAGAELDGDGLILARTVSAEGRSRAHLGGRSVPATVLGEMAEQLVAVHGQHDQQRLLRVSHQRDALDRFAGPPHLELVQQLRESVATLRAVEAEHADLIEAAAERRRELELLRVGLAEIERVEPQAGEDAALREEELRLGHADGLRTAATAAHEALNREDPEPGVTDAVTLLIHAGQALAVEADHDPALGELAKRLAEVGYLAADLASDLASYAAAVETDPTRLAVVQQRRADLSALIRAHGESIGDVLAWAEQAAARVLDLDGTDERIAQLGERRERLREELAAQATRLSGSRRSAGEAFSTAVGAELTALAMPHAHIEVALGRRENPDGLLVDGQSVAFGSHGIDEVEVLFAAHESGAPRPLGRGASGGELSRVMLAVEVVLAASDPVPTFVFDEVDAGVGGRAAVEVGRRLAMLSRQAQVVVVTHLPQVAAFADQHLTVVKDDTGAVVSSGVQRLDDAGRVRELSRMLAGVEGSASAQEHAAELLATAAQSKTRR